MGYEFADAQNIAVRSFLNAFSKNFQYFDALYKNKTLEYFDYKCPYTGVDLTKDNMVMDHVIPFNKENCGLHIYGNVLLVSKQANSKKSSHSLEDFLSNEPERLAKINKFIRSTNYLEVHNKYNERLKTSCSNLYGEIGDLIRDSIEKFDIKGFEDKSYRPKKIIVKKNNENIVCKSNTTSSLDKNEIRAICYKNGYQLPSFFTKSSKNSTQNTYWANPNIDCLEQDWCLILNDYLNKIIYCFKIPAKSISPNKIVVRSDKPNLIDLQIMYNDNFFTDSRSNISFAKWLEKEIKY